MRRISTMKPTIDSQHPVVTSEARENGAHRPFILLAETYNALVNELLIGTATTGAFRRHEPVLRSRAHRLLRGLAGGARQRLAMRSVVYLTRHIAQSSERDTLAEERRGAELSLLCGYDPALLAVTSLLVHHMNEAEVLKHAFSEVESLRTRLRSSSPSARMERTPGTSRWTGSSKLRAWSRSEALYSKRSEPA